MIFFCYFVENLIPNNLSYTPCISGDKDGIVEQVHQAIFKVACPFTNELTPLLSSPERNIVDTGAVACHSYRSPPRKATEVSTIFVNKLSMKSLAYLKTTLSYQHNTVDYKRCAMLSFCNRYILWSHSFAHGGHSTCCIQKPNARMSVLARAVRVPHAGTVTQSPRSSHT